MAVYEQRQVYEFAVLEFVIISESPGDVWQVTNACHLARPTVRSQPCLREQSLQNEHRWLPNVNWNAKCRRP